MRGARTKTPCLLISIRLPDTLHLRGMLHGASCRKDLECAQRLRRVQQLNCWLFFFFKWIRSILLWIKFCHHLYRSQMTRVFWNTVLNISIPQPGFSLERAGGRSSVSKQIWFYCFMNTICCRNVAIDCFITVQQEGRFSSLQDPGNWILKVT